MSKKMPYFLVTLHFRKKIHPEVAYLWKHSRDFSFYRIFLNYLVREPLVRLNGVLNEPKILITSYAIYFFA